MKLVGMITDVNQPVNINLIGDIVILDSRYVSDSVNELCYMEHDNGREWSDLGNNIDNILQVLNLMHSVANIEIIGVL